MADASVYAEISRRRCGDLALASFPSMMELASTRIAAAHVSASALAAAALRSVAKHYLLLPNTS